MKSAFIYSISRNSKYTLYEYQLANFNNMAGQDKHRKSRASRVED